MEVLHRCDEAGRIPPPHGTAYQAKAEKHHRPCCRLRDGGSDARRKVNCDVCCSHIIEIAASSIERCQKEPRSTRRREKLLDRARPGTRQSIANPKDLAQLRRQAGKAGSIDAEIAENRRRSARNICVEEYSHKAVQRCVSQARNTQSVALIEKPSASTKPERNTWDVPEAADASKSNRCPRRIVGRAGRTLSTRTADAGEPIPP